jgi:hypothetical protein
VTALTDPDMAMMLGEMKGQLRELIHQGNNQAMKNDAVARTLAKLEGMPDQLTEIERRLTTLETDKDRRDGRDGLWSALIRSPLVAWLFAAAVIGWTWLKGHGQ